MSNGKRQKNIYTCFTGTPSNYVRLLLVGVDESTFGDDQVVEFPCSHVHNESVLE